MEPTRAQITSLPAAPAGNSGLVHCPASALFPFVSLLSRDVVGSVGAGGGVLRRESDCNRRWNS